ncbi:MAG: phage holin [Succiniclasticum sp.]|nr:phage holin [Succiniclasticum sp.]
MKLNDGLYDILKWITMIVIPALATAYVGLAAVWGWPYADEVAKTSAVICTLLGALLGISTAQYNKDDTAGKHEIDG